MIEMVKSPCAGHDHVPCIAQVDEASSKCVHRCEGRSTWDQSFQLETRINTARSCRESTHLPLQLSTYCYHITPPTHMRNNMHKIV